MAWRIKVFIPTESQNHISNWNHLNISASSVEKFIALVERCNICGGFPVRYSLFSDVEFFPGLLSFVLTLARRQESTVRFFAPVNRCREEVNDYERACKMKL